MVFWGTFREINYKIWDLKKARKILVILFLLMKIKLHSSGPINHLDMLKM